MSKNPLDILLVEDDEVDALLLQSELKNSPFGPFSIEVAVGLEEAISHLEVIRFDAVLLDLGLPDSQGLGTLKRLQKHNTFNVPIVILTGLEDESLALAALQEGADDYLVKSGMPDTMRVRSIRFAIERKRANEAFLAAETQLSMAVQAAELGIFDLDLGTNLIKGSFQYAKLLGLAEGNFEWEFATLERWVHPEDRAGMVAAIEQARTNNQEYRDEYRVVWPDQSEHWIEGRGRVFKDGQGEPIRLLGTVMDISQCKAAEALTAKKADALQRLTHAHLTPRELTLLKMVAGGMPNKRIATELRISVTTVAKHRAHLMAKTKALNAADLARITTIAGLIPSVND